MIAYRPYIGQAPVAPATPIPALMPPTLPQEPKKEVSVPLVLGIGAVGGAVLGYLLSRFVLPKLGRVGAPVGQMSKFGALGGAIGGLAGTGTTLLLRS